MRQSKEIILTSDDGEQRRFNITALSARDGFELMQDGTLLLAKSGVIGGMLNKSENLQELGAQASAFDLSTIQNANIKKEDLQAFENALLKSVTYISPQGTMSPLNWDNVDQFCASPLDVFKLLKEAFAINFGFLKNVLASISPASTVDDMDTIATVKTSLHRPTFKVH